MITLVAIYSATLHGAIAVFQLLLVAGKPWGEYAWGGKHKGVLPLGFRIGSLISILILVAFTWINLATAALAPVPLAEFPLVTAQKIVTGYAALGVLMNGISRSRKERLLWMPVSVVLLALNLAMLVDS